MKFIPSFSGNNEDPVQLPTADNHLDDSAREDLESGIQGSRSRPQWLRVPKFLRGEDGDEGSGLSYFERLSLFVVALIGAFACYAICIFLFPFLSLRPRKFALIWSLGSVLFLLAFAILNGFPNFVQHLLSKDRIYFTAAFLGSILLTLFFSMVWPINICVAIACIIQVISSLYYTISYAPFGRQGLNMTTNVARSRVESWIQS